MKSIYSFSDFISDKNIITTAIGLIVALEVKQLTHNVTSTIISPIINKIVGHGGLNDISITIFDTKFELGSIITTLISFFIVMYIVYLVVKFTKNGYGIVNVP